MIFQQFALNVPDSVAMATWYVEHLDMQIAKQIEDDPYTRFLADKTGRVAIEIYSDPHGTHPQYSVEHPILFHLTFSVPEPCATKDMLLKAGATFIGEWKFENGAHIILMRDPWGIPLEFRKHPSHWAE